jgi:cystathionine beta-synthase
VFLPDGGPGYLSKIFSDDWMASYGFLATDGEATVGEVLRGKSGQLPSLVHTHPNETIRDAVEIMHEYGVSQMPVVSAEPPVMAGEVVGAVSERELLDALFAGTASLADAVSRHMAGPFQQVGSGENVATVRAALHGSDAVMVIDDGKPVGVLTRADLLAFLAGGRGR